MPNERSILFTNILRWFETETLKLDSKNKSKKEFELMKNILGWDMNLDYY